MKFDRELLLIGIEDNAMRDIAIEGNGDFLFDVMEIGAIANSPPVGEILGDEIALWLFHRRH